MGEQSKAVQLDVGARPGFHLLFVCVLYTLSVHPLWAQDEPEFTLEGWQTDPGVEPSLLGDLYAEWTENLTWDFDALVRPGFSRRRDQEFALFSAGLDLHKVISEVDRDFGTLVLQPYVTRRDNAVATAKHVEDDDDWEMEFHQVWLNVSRWSSKGRANIRIGHLLVPFGLEPLVNTHLTLRQLVTARNLGTKLDWGASLNGTFPRFDYEVAVVQGSGMELINRGKNFAVAGRIGTPYDNDFVVGMSVFYGRPIDPAGLRRYRQGDRSVGGRRTDDQLVRRLRLGGDLQWGYRGFTVLGEISAGRDFEQEVANALIEIGWSVPDGSLGAYLQGVSMEQHSDFGWDNDRTLRLGVEALLGKTWSVSGQLSQDFGTYRGRRSDSILELQVRLRF